MIAKLPLFDGQERPFIRYKGEFDWQGLYWFTRKWIDENRYRYHEKRYKHKGQEIEVNMLGNHKVDEMLKYHIQIDFHIWDWKPIEVEENGKMVKKDYGRVQIILNGSIEVDYADRFGDGSALSKVLAKWYMSIKKREHEQKYADEYTYHLFRFHRELKSFLKMSSDSNAFHYGN